MFGNNNPTPQTGGQDGQGETAREEKIISEVAKLRQEVNEAREDVKRNRDLLERLGKTIRDLESHVRRLG